MVGERIKGYVDTRIDAARDNLDAIIDLVMVNGPIAGLIPLVSKRGEEAATRRGHARRQLISPGRS